MTRVLLSPPVLAIVITLAALGGCGRRGALQPPPGATALPQVAAPTTSVDTEGVKPPTSQPPMTETAAQPAPGPKPAAKRGFFLDFLL